MRLPYQVFILDSGIGTPAGLWQGKETSKEVRGRPQGLYYVYSTTQTSEKYSATMRTVASFVVSDSIRASLNLAWSLGKPGKKRPKQR